jgi:hypothetical protein
LNWIVGIVTICLELASILVFQKIVSSRAASDIRRINKLNLNSMSRPDAEAVWLGQVLLTGVLIALIFDATIGYYMFNGWSYIANMVQIRDRDLYRLSIDFFFITTISGLFFNGMAKKILLARH